VDENNSLCPTGGWRASATSRFWKSHFRFLRRPSDAFWYQNTIRGGMPEQFGIEIASLV
jgi:hypothetical protein